MATDAARRVLITGASRGIGRELAVGLAERGLAVGLLARDQRRLDEVAAECRERGAAEVVVVVADVVDSTAVLAAVDEVESTLGGVDLLVNNAGVIEPEATDFLGLDAEQTWRVIEVNVRGPMLVTQAALRGMVRSGGGRVVNLSSGAAYKPMTSYTGYTVAKGALTRFTTQLNAQFQDRGVLAFDVAPGHVETEMTTAMPMHEGRTDWTPPEAVVELIAAVGAGRLDGLAGRHLRAGTDTVESLLARQPDIVERDARALRMVPIDDADPVR
ncbi:SDR family NAD(P)-dependent oxidoreductase [Phytoactinopolyspora limicola]|uniref:SDR family NAD(P)-dependent oxidoreductase n=1 Tax=Phytoactinopolyspora limicola TaxID=2715536 RepID=UPI00140DFED6|nr:SDR family oxidoreductase [Phytoactinopolyspora limicola]